MNSNGIAARGVFLLVLVVLPGSARPARAERLQPETAKAWDRYLAWADAKNNKEVSDPKNFLIEEFLDPRENQSTRQQLLAGQVIIRRAGDIVPAGTKFSVPSGEIHHWWGSILVPKASLSEVLAFLKDYDHHAGRFSDVERSRLLAHNGDTYRFFFRLKRTKAIVTAYYNTEQECTYYNRGPGRASSRSHAIKIAEVENPGSTGEREKPMGDDRGFLWRLVSWWRFQEIPEGVIVQCESASLSRDIPAIIRFLPGVPGYIRSTPRESLESILLSIRSFAKGR